MKNKRKTLLIELFIYAALIVAGIIMSATYEPEQTPEPEYIQEVFVP
ncbi:hypothetical protein FACS18949_15880 [Clostridia bacterium]|nr:hypothetical protein FACS1894202_11110 [Clostridia bacterium]GHV17196.1 hypothetical protein FACS189425_02920 [Clostridia bacterium]GHV36454.1 hypothetical protein FACS18949_15880 [Clostridia bacterium]